MAEYNYQHSLSLLKSIEKIVHREHFHSLFVVDEYDFFEAYRYRIFSDIKGWKKREGVYGTINIWVKIRVFLLNIFGLAVSFLGMLQLLISRRKIIVYSPDRLSDSKKHHDFRLGEVYVFLENNSLPYQEVLHTNISRTFCINIFRRRRLPIYLESFEFLYSVLRYLNVLKKVDLKSADDISLSEIDIEDRDLARLILRKYLAEFQVSLFKIRSLTRILKYSNTRLLLTIDDPRSYNELLVATKRNEITTVAFQHGHFTKYHLGWLTSCDTPHKSIMPDSLYVWSTYWKDELGNLGSFFPAEAVKVAVPDKISKLKSNTRVGSSSGCVSVLIPYETDAPIEEVKKYIQAILACPNTKIFFKTRSDISEKKQCDEYGLLSGENVEIIKSLDTVISQVDVVIGVYSTFLYDMVAYNIPVGILETGMDYGEGMLRNSVAERVGLEGIHTRLEQLKNTLPSTLSLRRKKVYSDIYPTVDQVLTGLVASIVKK